MSTFVHVEKCLKPKTAIYYDKTTKMWNYPGTNNRVKYPRVVSKEMLQLMIIKKEKEIKICKKERVFPDIPINKHSPKQLENEIRYLSSNESINYLKLVLNDLRNEQFEER